MSDNKTNFPSETIELPSKGHFYSEEDPLSSGKIELKYMTAREEDILTSRNLIQKGIVLDRLLESLIVSDNVNLGTMLIGDKNAVMIAARILGYGKDYNVTIRCPSCDEPNSDVIDLSQLDHKDYDFSQYTRGINEFELALPASNRKLTYKLLTHADEKAIDNELKSLKKISKTTGIDAEVTTRLKRAIVAVDGETDPQQIIAFVSNNFLSRDSLAFRQHLASSMPDVDLNYEFDCDACSYTEIMPLPMSIEFFWPAGR